MGGGRTPLLLAVLLPLLLCKQASGEIEFSDAEYLAADLSDSLLAPDTLVARIEHDLQLIRLHTPAVVDVHHSCERMMLGAVDLTFTYQAKQLFLAGQHAELNALHARLGTPEVRWLFEYSCCFFLPHPYHPQRLAELYAVVWGIFDAHPESECIGDGPDIRIQPDGTYRFRYAWGENCIAGGCDYGHVWVFRVAGEEVTVLEDSGDLVATEQVSWGGIKAIFR
jgi:hypothetical protein